jgi:hypothetical protein
MDDKKQSTPPLTFGRAVLRTAFVLLLMCGMTYPQLNAESPSPFFAQIRDSAQSLPMWVWAAACGAWVVVLWLVTHIVNHRPSAKSVSTSAATIAIGDAVKSTSGGNGLASAAFTPALAWLGIAGWVEITSPGMECVVVDGRQVMRKTQLLIAPSHWLGRPINARRILLQPAPLDVEAKALTRDQLELTLKVSVKYTVKNPTYIASVQAPLSELENLVIGVAAEHIRAETLESIVTDDGALRQALRLRLENAPSLKGRFTFIEVLKALPTGDERMIEIIRQTQEVIAKREYVEEMGRNRVAEAKVQQEIERLQADLQEEKAQRDHARIMESATAQNDTTIRIEVIRAMAQAASSGLGNAEALRIFSQLVRGPNYQTAAQLAAASPKSEGLIASERRALEGLRDQLGIVNIELQSDPSNVGRPKNARITFPKFDVLMDCPTEYPKKAPSVKLHTTEGASHDIVVPWGGDSDLASATASAWMQAQTKLTALSSDSSTDK